MSYQTFYRPKIYTASCTHHAGFWQSARNNHNKVDFIATWPRQVIAKVEENQANMRQLWDINLKEVALCDILFIKSDPGDVLRGALIEAGYALALGKPVYCIGNGTFGSWPHLRTCHGPFPTLGDAIDHVFVGDKDL